MFRDLSSGTPEAAVNRTRLVTAATYDLNRVQVGAGLGPEPHPYPEGDAFMLVLAGALNLTVDGTTETLAAGDMALIPRGAVRGFKAGPAGAVFVAGHLKG